MLNEFSWPMGKKFAFTIFDDTDHSTVENVGPVYDFLAGLGIMTTKSAWPLAPVKTPKIGGDTLDNPRYREFVLNLQNKGFEIGFHGATCHDSERARTEAGLLRFRDILGKYPSVHCNHCDNAENVYWGLARLEASAICKLGYRLATARRNVKFSGHIPNSPMFWGDLCREHITYVRNFVFREINLLKINPTTPYYDPRKPYVNFWFSSCEANDVDQFCRLLVPANQQRLEDEGGLCILYTHFANGFVRENKINPLFEKTMKCLADRPGWFAPVSTVLDYMRKQNGDRTIPAAELKSMERRWFVSKLLHGTS